MGQLTYWSVVVAMTRQRARGRRWNVGYEMFAGWVVV